MLRHSSISMLGLLLAATSGVCLAQFSSESAARVVALNGSVSILRDSQPWALQMGAHIRPGQTIVTGSDGYARFEVSDGSTFEIFSNSKVSFRDNPGNWKDLLDVLLGRIKVHVQKLGGQPNHNRVHTPTAIISVRGTTFDILVDDEDTTLVSVEEGQVLVEHRTIPGGKLLNPGESVRVFKNEPLARAVVDKTTAIQTAMRAASDAFYNILLRRSGGVGGSGGGGTAPGDHGQTKPAPPPPSTNPGGDGPPGPPPGY